MNNYYEGVQNPDIDRKLQELGDLESRLNALDEKAKKSNPHKTEISNLLRSVLYIAQHIKDGLNKDEELNELKK